MTNIYIGPSRSNGRGLFAKVRFKKNQVLFTVEGKIKVESYGPDYWVGPRWVGINVRTWLAPSKDDYAYYLNHSCDSNSGLKDQVVLVAMSTIERGEEITLDYSLTEVDPYWKMNCKCGKQNCRRIIRSGQFLPEEVYRKYQPFVPEFVRQARMETCG